MKKRAIDTYQYPIVTLIAFMIVGFYAFVTFNVSFMAPIARALKSIEMTDIYYQISQATGETPESHVVTIVDASGIRERRELAQALEVIESFGPKSVGVDMIFQGLKDDSLGDEMVRSVAETYDNLVFSYELMEYDPKTQQYAKPRRSFFADDLPDLLQGATNMPRRDLYDGIKRLQPVGFKYNDEVVPSFATQVVNTYAGEEARKLSEANIKINYRKTIFNTVHVSELAEHPELIEDRVVLFGDMMDRVDAHYTPLGKIPGVEVLAYSVQTVLDQKELKSLPKWLSWITWLVSFLIPMFTHWWTTAYINYQNTHQRNVYVRAFMTSLMVIGFLRFVWMSILTGIGYLLFNFFDWDVNYGWAFSAICFLTTGQGFYNVIAAKSEDDAKAEPAVVDSKIKN